VVLVPLGTAMTTCVVGVPILAYALGSLTRCLLRGARRVHGVEGPVADEPRWVGAAALFALVLVLAAMGVGASAASVLLAAHTPSVQLAGALTVGVATAVALGAALGPGAFVPLALADRGTSVGSALALSFELAARLGTRRAIVLGAGAAACIAVPVALACVVLLDPLDEHGVVVSVVLALPLGLAVGPSLAGALLADAYVDASARARREPVEAPAHLRTLALLVVPAFALLGGALAVAALTPTRMRELPPEPSSLRSWRAEGPRPAPVTRPLPGGRAYVRTTERGVVLEAHDGGGAGAVSAGFDTSESIVSVRDGARYGGPEDTHAVVITDGTRWAVTIVDSDGVRLDDGLGARVLARLGTSGALALVLALALLLALAARWIAAVGEARALDVPELREAGRTRGLAALEGTLRLDGASTLSVERTGGRFRVERDAFVEAEAGALRFRVPAGRELGWLGAAPPEPLVDGARVLLVSRFEAGAARGLREGARPWPDDGRLALGSRADATRALVERATRIAAWASVPALLGLAFAAAHLLASL
jgi:hypothetical protein